MKPRRAITLVELLVCLAVVLILAAILFPVFNRTHCNERRPACQSNLKQIGLALAQYGQDYERLPRATGNGAVWGWAQAIAPYHKAPQIYECPSDGTKRQNDPKRPSYTDYWMNARFSNWKIAGFETPARAIGLGDGDGSSPSSDARYALLTVPPNWRTDNASPAKIHLDGANYLFVDGHVKWIRPENIGENWRWK